MTAKTPEQLVSVYGDMQLPEKPLAHGMAAARHTAR